MAKYRVARGRDPRGEPWQEVPGHQQGDGVVEGVPQGGGPSKDREVHTNNPTKRYRACHLFARDLELHKNG